MPVNKGIKSREFVLLKKMLMTSAHSLKVIEKRVLTPSSVELSFQLPQELLKHYAFQAGQYLTLAHQIEGKEVRRSYSLCSAPCQNTWKVGIKKVEGGLFSTWANDHLEVGESLKVFAPQGKFVINPTANDSSHYLAFAAGSGITPIMSMIQEVLDQAPKAKFTLVYGNQSPEETMFLDELEQRSTAEPERFNLIQFYSRTQVDGARFGRIDTGAIKHLFLNELSGIQFDQFMMCGPEAMIQTLREILPDHGGQPENMHDELFFSSEADVEQTQEGQCVLSVVLDGETSTFNIDKNTPVLDAVLNQDLDPPYSCQGGVCSSCIALVTEGQATMIKNQILTDNEVAEGLVLTCQTLAQSDQLTIDYDEA